LAGAPGLTVWRWCQPQHFHATTAYSGGLNVMPLTILDVAAISAAVYVSD